MTRPSMRARRQGSMSPARWQARWWEAMLPAGLWVLAGSLVLKGARALRHAGLLWPGGVFAALRLSARLSRTGFNVWRFWGRKWR